MPDLTALNAARRTADLTALADGAPLDVAVIGGGITGVGIALDAASRGLRVALVEKHDLAFGTSRWSSKLVHGGLRYLASGNVGIARRSANERGMLMTRNAPHLVHAMPQLVPTVRRDGLDGGFLAYDGQLIDDARLVTAVARTAAQHGARILTYVAASEATGTSVRLTDRRTGESFDVSAGAVINAAGVWAGEIDDSLRLRPSRGTHLVFNAAAFGNPTAALTIPIPGELNRFVFAMPEQLGRVYLGLTDEAAPGAIPDVPEPSDEEIAFLLGTVNTALGTELGTGDVIGAYAGLRPLIDTGEGRTADVSREHAVVEGPSGVISIIGGKLTEYRYMAEDVVDFAIARRHLRAANCRTRNLPLIGAPANSGSAAGPGAGLPASLVARYGAEAPNVVASATCDRPTEPVAEGIDVTRAEFEYAVTHECALDVDDILDRRTRIGLVPGDRERVVAVAGEFLAGIGK